MDDKPGYHSLWDETRKVIFRIKVAAIGLSAIWQLVIGAFLSAGIGTTTGVIVGKKLEQRAQAAAIAELRTEINTLRIRLDDCQSQLLESDEQLNKARNETEQERKNLAAIMGGTDSEGTDRARVCRELAKVGLPCARN